MDMLQSSPIYVSQIRNGTSKDPALSKVQTLILQGWTYTPDKELQPYQLRVKCTFGINSYSSVHKSVVDIAANITKTLSFV